MADSPAPRPGGAVGPPGPPGSSGVPARLLSTAEFEAVIQRAVELQTVREDMAEGLTEAEVLRIGQELGLEPVAVRRAIAEVRSRPAPEKGLLAGMMGPGTVRAARTIRRPAAELGMFIEQYLVQVECMVVERRYPDRTRYRRGAGMSAALARMAAKWGSRHAALDLPMLDVGVAVAGDDTSIVELSVDLQPARAGFAAGAAATGVGAGGTVALVVVASTAPPLLALLGIPVLVGAALGVRGAYRYHAHTEHNKLEGFLDRLEHNELRLPPAKADWRKQLGI